VDETVMLLQKSIEYVTIVMYTHVTPIL